jgi:tetratricopeptide (TPR) repeat protein
MELPPDQQISKAREQLEAGDPRTAFASLRRVYREAAFAEQTPELVASLRLFARIAEALDLEQFAAIAERAADFPDEVQALYDLGYECLEHDLHWLAACVLQRAWVRARDSAGVLSELVTALESSGRYEEARAHLKSAPIVRSNSFLLRYLFAFNSMMSGRPLDVPALVERLGEPSDDTEAFMKARIEGMLARWRMLGEIGDNDLRGWHFVLTGGVLLHVSPYGFDEGMNGRYAYTQDSYGRCRYGLERLRAVLEAWDVTTQRVLCLPDRASRILGLAAGTLLELPVEPYAPDRSGLIVAYDLGRLDPDTPAELLSHRPGQILFAHATCWTDTPPCAPDLTTLLYQIGAAPWDAKTMFTDDGPVREPADEGTVEELAARVVGAEAEEAEDELPSDTREALVAFAGRVRAGASVFADSGRRSPLWVGGPVDSSRFG